MCALIVSGFALNIIEIRKITLITISYFAVIPFLITFVIGRVFNQNPFYSAWRKSDTESVQFKNDSLQAKYNSLENKINPHFFFNSLNSLSSLIQEDSAKADKFIYEMAFVYRYLLAKNEETLTTVKKELDFIKAYTFLLGARFNENVKVEININESILEYKMPRFALQIVMENAIKHNIISFEKPLKIVILGIEKNKLVMQNNRQPKKSPLIIDKIGLNFISKKYEALKQANISITQTADLFEVKIPLIKPNRESKVKK